MKKLLLVSLLTGYFIFSLMDSFIIIKEAEEEKKPNPNFMFKRLYPFNEYSKQAYLTELNKAKIQRVNSRLSKTNSTEWQFAGPINIGGRITDLEYDPLNPKIIYAGAATGGLFKSEDGGRNWNSIFDEQASLSIGDIKINPVNPNVIYVGTGEANGGHNNFPGVGLFKSDDAGETWKHLGLEESASIGRILINPEDPSEVFVAAVGSYFKPNPQRGVFRSSDGGESWEKVLFISDSTGAIDLIMKPDNPDALLAAMWERVRPAESLSQTHLYGPTGGIYKSEDGGDSWRKISNGLPSPDNEKIGRIGLTVCEDYPDVVYALYNDGTSVTGVYKSSDFGETWEYVRTPSSNNFSWFFGQIRVSPDDSNEVYVMDVALSKSTDGGKTWLGLYGYDLHVDHHAMDFHPQNSDTVINGNDGGINLSYNSGRTWLESPDLPVTQFYEIGIDPNDAKRLYGGTQDNNTIRTMTGRLDDWEHLIGGDGFYVIVDHENSDIVYAESQFGGLAKSTNGGVTFNYNTKEGINSDDPFNWSTPIAMDPVNSSILYLGTNKIYRTENGAEYWEAISPVLTGKQTDTRLNTITTISISEVNNDIVYAGTADGKVWIYENGNWTEITNGLPKRWVTRVLADPVDENMVYVTFSGLKWRESEARIFVSRDKGATWQNISSNIPEAPVNSIAVNPADNNIIYTGTDLGAYVTFNGGSHWQPIAGNLPIVPVNDMKIHPTGNYLVIGTHGRGMYKIELNEIISNAAGGSNLPKDFALLRNYPNPFNPSTTIEYEINIETEITISIYDVLGKEVDEIYKGRRAPGKYSINWSAANSNGHRLSSGNYFVVMASEQQRDVIKVNLIK